MMNRRIFPLIAALLFAPMQVAGAANVVTVEIEGARLHVGDIIKDCPPDAAKLDLGPAPAAAASRVFTRAELTRLLRDAGYSGKTRLAEAVRVVRKMNNVSASDLESAIRKAPLPKGVSIASVRAPRTLDVPAGHDRVSVELGQLPRRAGPHRATARIVFARGEETLATVPVPVELSISADAARPDIARGTPLTVLVRRGMIEVSAVGVAGADGDVGSTIPVTIRTTGRVVKAKLVEPARALLVETP